MPTNPSISRQTEPRPPFKTIIATNVQRGQGPILATCDLKVGGLLIHGVIVRRGRHGTTYVNLPSVRRDGQWMDAIEFTSARLEDAIRQVVLAAVGEVTR